MTSKQPHKVVQIHMRHPVKVFILWTRNNAKKWKQNDKRKKEKMLETITCEFMILVVLRFFRLTGDCATVQIFFSLRAYIIDFSFILSIVTNHSFFLRLVIISCHYGVITILELKYFVCLIIMIFYHSNINR